MGTKTFFGVALLLSVFACASVAQAQEPASAPKMELYGGYDYIRFNIHSNVAGQPPFQTFNANGAGGQLVFNVNNWLGVLGDASGYWATNSRTAGAAFPYLFGPRANLRRSAFTPFAQALFGGIVTSGGIKTTGWQNNFAMAVGGGIDVRVSKRLSIRPVQAEYFLTKIPDGVNNRQNNFRFSAGISLLLGRR